MGLASKSLLRLTGAMVYAVLPIRCGRN